MGAAVTMAYGQGHVVLNNYAMNYSVATSSYLGDPVLYGLGSGGTLGTKVALASGFNLELAYAFGTVSGSGATGQNANPGSLDAGFTESGTTGIIGTGGNTGYFLGGTVSLPGYTPGTPVTLEFLAFNGASYAASTIRGHSEAITLASVTTGTAFSTQPTGFTSAGFFIDAVTAVPEPTTLALVGLGAAGLLALRRRKA
jgi:hypothetical protein